MIIDIHNIGKASYPENHKLGMHIPKGGASCLNCIFLTANGIDCGNSYFIQWNNGDTRIPTSADEYVSDWYEPGKDIAAGGPGSGRHKGDSIFSHDEEVDAPREWGDWHSNIPIMERVNLQDLIPTQTDINPLTGESLKDEIEHTTWNGSRNNPNPVEKITVVRHNGKLYIADGHHRAGDAILKGDVQIKALVYSSKQRQDIAAYGTSEGVTKSWDTRGRGVKVQPPVKPLATGQSTEEAWKKPNGEWDDKRAAWHKAIVDSYINGKHPIDIPPEATIMGGGTAVGKTTLSKKIVGENSNIVRVDADEIKTLIPEYEELKKTDPENAATRVHEESSYIAKSILAEGAARGLNLTYDATSSGGGAVKMVQKLASEGYTVHVLFADVPIEVARQRAESRSKDVNNASGFGRVINDDLMTTSHRLSAQNFLRLKDMPEATSAHLFSTLEDTPGMVYGRSGKSNGIVYDDDKWGKYMQKAKGSDINSAAVTSKLKPGQYIGVDNDIFKTDKDVDEFSKLLNKAKVERINREKDEN